VKGKDRKEEDAYPFGPLSPEGASTPAWWQLYSWENSSGKSASTVRVPSGVGKECTLPKVPTFIECLLHAQHCAGHSCDFSYFVLNNPVYQIKVSPFL
jgi:hypothetical protein